MHLFVSPQQALLLCYSSDCTAVLCQSVATSKNLGIAVTRKGRILQEFLAQKALLKTRGPSGEERGVVLYSDPLPMGAGKKAWNIYAAGAAFHPCLRQVHRSGICIFHVSADRAVAAPLFRMFLQRQAAFYSAGYGPQWRQESPLLVLTDWCVHTPCALHDLGNALK